MLLTPAAPSVAPPTTPLVDTPEGEAEGRYSGIYNLPGHRQSLPCGWSLDGLPIGLQLAAALAADAALLAAARYDEDLGEGVSTVRLGDLVVSLVRSEHAYPACPAGTRTS